MSKPRHFFWYRYNVGEMELRCKGMTPMAELILHRLIRVYFSIDEGIETTHQQIALLCAVPEIEVSSCWDELSKKIDLSGPAVKIPWMDDEIEDAKRRSNRGKKAAGHRWGETT